VDLHHSQKLNRQIDELLSKLHNSNEGMLPVKVLFGNELTSNEDIDLDSILLTKGLIDIFEGRRRLTYAGQLVCERGGWLKESDNYNSQKINYSLAIADFKQIHDDLSNESKFEVYQRVYENRDKYYEQFESILVKHFYGHSEINRYIWYLQGLKKNDQILNNDHATEDLIAFGHNMIGIIEQMRKNETGESIEEKFKLLNEENVRLLHRINQVEKENKSLKNKSNENHSVNQKSIETSSGLYKPAFYIIVTCFALEYMYKTPFISDQRKPFYYIIILITATFLYFRDAVPSWVSILLGIIISLLGIIFQS